ncbi:HAD family hydrolase [Methylibium sp.]|uniref:HAD family hydrolase n=1 Tax=Methylibium sp. TaxID=2067992 RepID=UPI003D0B3144
MKLALFDLDHTLLPYDSGMAWIRFLVARGVFEPALETDYLAHCQRYVDGELDVAALHRSMVAPLGRLTRAELSHWLDEFETEVSTRLPHAARMLVARHLGAGDLCCIVTATSRLVAERFARALRIEHVLATESAIDLRGVPTGEIVGPPCHGEHKLDKVRTWLLSHGRPLDRLERSWFYSDSASDLPLLRAVSDPVAVRPDARLQAIAQHEAWPIEMLGS